MGCSQTLAGLARDCGANIGGIKAVYLANHDDVDTVTLTAGVVSAITMVSSKKFYAYFFNPQTSSFTTTIQANRENGSLFFETVLSLVFTKQDATKRVEIDAIAQAGLAVIVVDNNGNAWYLGYDEPVLLTAGTAETGTARADRNGYAIELTDAQAQMPYTVDSSIIAGLL